MIDERNPYADAYMKTTEELGNMYLGVTGQQTDELGNMLIGVTGQQTDELGNMFIGVTGQQTDELGNMLIGVTREQTDEIRRDLSDAKASWYEAMSAIFAFLGGCIFAVLCAKLLFVKIVEDAAGNTRMIPDPKMYVIDIIMGLLMAAAIYLVFRCLPFGKRQ